MRLYVSLFWMTEKSADCVTGYLVCDIVPVCFASFIITCQNELASLCTWQALILLCCIFSALSCFFFSSCC